MTQELFFTVATVIKWFAHRQFLSAELDKENEKSEKRVVDVTEEVINTLIELGKNNQGGKNEHEVVNVFIDDINAAEYTLHHKENRLKSMIFEEVVNDVLIHCKKSLQSPLPSILSNFEDSLRNS